MKRFLTTIVSGFLMLSSLGAAFGESQEKVGEKNWRQEITVGEAYVNQDNKEALFQKYGEVPSGLLFERYLLGYTGSSFDLSMDARNMRLDNQSVELKYWRNDGWKLTGIWSKIPNLTSLTTKTPYMRDAGGVFRLPDIMQSSVETNYTVTSTLPTTGVNAGKGSTSEVLNSTAKKIIDQYAAMAAPVDLKIQRDEYGVKLENTIAGMDVEAEVGFETKKGTKAIGASFGFSNVVELPEPVDYETIKVKAGAKYEGEDWNVILDYNLTSFHNRVSTMEWENPRSTKDTTWQSAYSGGRGPSIARMDLYPDNIYYEIGATSTYRLDKKTRFAVALGYGMASQNDQLLPFTSNTSVTPSAVLTAQVGSTTPPDVPPYDMSDRANLPRQTAYLSFKTLSMKYALTFEPMEDMNALLQYRSYQLDNNSTGMVVPGIVVLDAVYTTAAASTSPTPSHKYQNIDGDVNWSLMKELSVGVGGGVEFINRTQREVEKSTEIKGQISCRLKPMDDVNVKLAYDMAQRRMDDFKVEDYTLAGALAIRPGLRMPDVTDRDLTRLSGGAAFNVLPDMLVNVQGHYDQENFLPGKGDLSGGVVNSSFAATQYGMLDMNRYGGTFSMEYPVLKELSVALFYDYQYVFSHDRSNNSSSVDQKPAYDWEPTNTDVYNTVGMNLEMELTSDVKMDFGYTMSYGTNNVAFPTVGSGITTPVTPKQNRSLWHELSTKWAFKVSDAVTLVARYGLEAYEVSDWATDGLSLIDPSYTVMFLGDFARPYLAHTGFLGINYRW